MKPNSISLSGRWTLAREGMSPVPANLPGDNYSALFQAGLIPDPYFGRNELLIQKERTFDWTYSREFDVPDELLSFSRVLFEVDFVDTFAEITLNGQPFLSCSNLFRHWSRDAKPFLQPGRNTILILLKSPERIAARMAEKLPFPVPQGSYIGSPHQNCIRKCHCSGGWDWGPTILVSGVYGEILLRGADDFLFRSLNHRQKHLPGVCELTAVLEIESEADSRREIIFRFGNETKTMTVQLEKGPIFAECVFRVEKPDLWWPNGYGGQPLYGLSASCGLEFLSEQVGLRSLELITEKDPDGTGSSMTVRVNGVDVFCKGASWIPVDALPERWTPERYEMLMDSAAAANMNMLRCWGGGIYEKEIFYDLCDRKGILVWQDLMFSCSQYPATDEFLAEVESELEFQYRRLRFHACIALWCGDNEVLGSLNWYPPCRKNRDRYLVNYDRLNRMLGKLSRKLDPSRCFWPTSPGSGTDDFADNWHNDAAGDMHYWSVWSEGRTFDAYFEVKPRFCSEFGYQSYPSLETVRSFAGETDFNVLSPAVEHHQKHRAGCQPILSMIGHYFRMPGSFADFLYISQLQHALAMRTAVEYWRTLRTRCMGTLYWQLNDVWPAVSWSSVEYSGHWKQLHYHARRFYRPFFTPAFSREKGKICVHAVNDRPYAVPYRTEVNAFRFDGTPVWNAEFKNTASAGSSVLLMEFIGEEHGTAPEEFFLTVETVAENGESWMEAVFAAPYKECALPRADVTAQTLILEDRPAVRLTSDAPAFFVTLETAGILGRFTDNSLSVIPGREVILFFESKEKVSAEELRKALTLCHLEQAART